MPIGLETQVNTYTTGNQTNQQITALSDGGWVITWQSSGQDGSGTGIYAQAYNADGTAQGGETQVNTYTTSSQDIAQITALSDGGWVITWQSSGQDGDGYGIYAQAYNGDGTTQGGEVQVNTYTTSSQDTAQITALSDGGWVISWLSLGQDGSAHGVYAQAYNSDGTAQGGEVQVNTYTTFSQFDQQITALSDGGWVITWVTFGQDGDSYGTYAQAYNADGTTQGGEVQVNTYTTYSQTDPQIAALSDGGWVITWLSYNQDGSGPGIYAQAYNADGTTQGGEVQVNAYTPSDQNKQQITALEGGGWVITWESYGQDGDEFGVYAQAYNANGTVQGGEVQINKYTTNTQQNPQITALSDGGWVITWQSLVQDGDYWGVYAQAYNADGTTQGGEVQVNAYTTGEQSNQQIIALEGGGWVITWESYGQDGDSGGIYSRAFQPLEAGDYSVAITGVQQVGQVLTAAITGINAADTTVYSVMYSWFVDGVLTASSDDPTFTLTAAHSSAEVTVFVHVQDTLFDVTFAQQSPATAAIDDGNNDPTGVITLTSDNVNPAKYDIGHMITGDTSTLVDGDGLGTFSYQWLRGVEAIGGANSIDYMVTAADEGHKLRLVITYQDGAGFDESIASSAARIAGYTGINLDGTALDETLIGTSENDRLHGRSGDDILVGADGRDKLRGGSGEDVLSGGGGRDVLHGGGGDDLLLGGANRDKFIFGSNHGNDTIGDFEDGIDRIKIASGALAFGDLTVAQDGDDVLISYASKTITISDTFVADITDADFMF